MPEPILSSTKPRATQNHTKLLDCQVFWMPNDITFAGRRKRT